MLEHFQTHRQLLFDLTANYLDPLETSFERLAYLASLRQKSSGKYVHGKLAAVYGEERVDQVVAACHEEVFERLLEMPLRTQEEGLRCYVSKMGGAFAEKVAECERQADGWVPGKSPKYLTELYSSNLRALVELLLDSTTRARSSK